MINRSSCLSIFFDSNSLPRPIHQNPKWNTSHKDTDVDEWVGSEEEGLDSAVSWFVDEGTETGVSI